MLGSPVSAASNRPSGLKATVYRNLFGYRAPEASPDGNLESGGNERISLPVARFQRSTFCIDEVKAEASNFPSGLNAIDPIKAGLAFSSLTRLPVAESHIFAMPSKPLEASNLLSGLKTRDSTLSAWPGRVFSRTKFGGAWDLRTMITTAISTIKKIAVASAATLRRDFRVEGAGCVRFARGGAGVAEDDEDSDGGSCGADTGVTSEDFGAGIGGNSEVEILGGS